MSVWGRGRDKLCMGRHGPVGVEVGVWKGEFARALLWLPRLERLYLVDPWRAGGGPERIWGDQAACDQAHRECVEMVAEHEFSERAYLLRLPSVAAAAALKEAGVVPDWVYVDGDHSGQAVWDDLWAWWRILGPEGMLAGDDYSESHAGVRDAVEAFAGAANVPVHRAGDQYWFLKEEARGHSR